MADSKLVSYTRWLDQEEKGHPHGRTTSFGTIAIHHMAGNLSLEACGNALKGGDVSAHYGIDSSGRIGQYVHEAYASWSMGSSKWNNCTISIECANDRTGGDWHVSDKTIASLKTLIVDIAKRHGWKSINFSKNPETSDIIGHRDVASTVCPGNYLYAKIPSIAKECNDMLKGTTTKRCMQASYNATGSQVWRIVKCGDYVKIVNKNGQCLDVKGGSAEPMKDGRIIQGWKDNGTDAQLWKLIKNDINDGFFIASKLNESYVLDVCNGTINKRAYVQLHSRQTKRDSQYAQTWYLLENYGTGKEYKCIVNAKSLMCLDINPTGVEV